MKLEFIKSIWEKLMLKRLDLEIELVTAEF
jgi:hypothetical protein